MAKVRSIIRLSGEVGGMVFVDSKTYGKYARAKRGTYILLPLSMTPSKNQHLNLSVHFPLLK